MTMRDPGAGYGPLLGRPEHSLEHHTAPSNRSSASFVIRSLQASLVSQASGIAEAPQMAPASCPVIAATVSASSARFAASKTASRGIVRLIGLELADQKRSSSHAAS